MSVAVAATKTCGTCGKEANVLPPGTYRSDDSTVFVFDDADNRGYFCPNCVRTFGAPVASRPADPKRGLMSLDESA